MKNKEKALYVHVPFCHNLCYYCDFLKVIYNKKWADEYLVTLFKELEDSEDSYNSIYIGGGSPSSLSVEQLTKLLAKLSNYKSSNCEFCMEINPEDMTEEKIGLLVRYGINRVSIGVQTFNDELLRAINRKHDYQQVKSLIASLRANKITNITCDLLFGLPKQTNEILRNDLDILTEEFAIPHISIYALLVEQNTYFSCKHIAALDDDLQAEQYAYIYEYLRSKGYVRYEVSNYAKAGYESKHNLVYWYAKEYKGIGPGASGYENSIRYEISRSLSAYCQGYINKDTHYIDKEEQEYEYIILSLRLKDGLSFQEYTKLFSKNFLEVYHNQVERLLKKGLIEIKNDHLYVVDVYVFILNQILEEFTPD